MKNEPEVALESAYEAADGEPQLWRLHCERAREDDPFMARSARGRLTRAEHKRIVKSKPHHRWFLIRHGRACAGAILISKQNEIGIYLFQRHRSQGLGALALRELLTWEAPIEGVNGGEFRALIHPQNFRSAKLFERAGFVHRLNVYEPG